MPVSILCSFRKELINILSLESVKQGFTVDTSDVRRGRPRMCLLNCKYLSVYQWASVPNLSAWLWPVGAARGHHFLSASSWCFKLSHLYHTVSLCGHAFLCPEPINLSQNRCTSRHGRREPCPLSASSRCSKQARPRNTAIKHKFYKHHGAISIDLLHRAVLQR